jgi:hypothetical protein
MARNRKESSKSQPEEFSDKPNKLDLHDVISNLYTKLAPPLTNEENFKEVYMLQRFLSMRSEGFWPAQTLNTFSNKLPPWAAERILMPLIAPQRRAPFGKYIKAPEGAKTHSKAILARLGRVFHCNLKHAQQTALVLEAQGVDVYALFGESTPKQKEDLKPVRTRKKKS